MYIKSLVLILASFALCQITTSFVIKDQDSMDDVTQSPHVNVDSVSFITDTIFSAIEFDEDEKQAKQPIEKNQDKTSDIKTNDNNQNNHTNEGHESMSQSAEKEEEGASIHHGKGVNGMKSTTEDDDEEKNEKYTHVQNDSNESDEARKKSHKNKNSQYEEENEAEEEADDESTNKDNHENNN